VTQLKFFVIKVGLKLFEISNYVHKHIQMFLKAIIGQRHVAIQITGYFNAWGTSPNPVNVIFYSDNKSSTFWMYDYVVETETDNLL